MTRENRKKNLRDEWRLSEEAWSEGELLQSQGFFRGAVSRYYYSAFYAARAALLSREVEAKTHSGTRAELNRLFVHA